MANHRISIIMLPDGQARSGRPFDADEWPAFQVAAIAVDSRQRGLACRPLAAAVANGLFVRSRGGFRKAVSARNLPGDSRRDAAKVARLLRLTETPARRQRVQAIRRS